MRHLLLALFFLPAAAGAQLTTTVYAENYVNASEVQKLPNKPDTRKVVQMNNHDWIDLPVTIPDSGVYKLTLRIAGTLANVWIYDTSFNVLGVIHATGSSSSERDYHSYSKNVFLLPSITRIRLQVRQALYDANRYPVSVNVSKLDIAATGLILSNDFNNDYDTYAAGYYPWQYASADSLRSTQETSTGYYGWIKQTARPSALTIYSTMEGLYSAAVFNLAKSDSATWPYCRSEIYKSASPYQTMWVGFDFMTTTTYRIDKVGGGDSIIDKNPQTFFQCHGMANISPCVSARIDTGHYILKVLWSNVPNPTIHMGETVYDMGPVVPGLSHKWVFKIKWAWDNTGMLQVWKDGVEVVTRLNAPNCYNEPKWPYKKFGVYKWGWKGGRMVNGVWRLWSEDSPQNEVTCYYTHLRIGGPNSNYNEIANIE